MILEWQKKNRWVCCVKVAISIRGSGGCTSKLNSEAVSNGLKNPHKHRQLCANGATERQPSTKAAPSDVKSTLTWVDLAPRNVNPASMQRQVSSSQRLPPQCFTVSAKPTGIIQVPSRHLFCVTAHARKCLHFFLLAFCSLR